MNIFLYFYIFVLSVIAKGGGGRGGGRGGGSRGGSGGSSGNGGTISSGGSSPSPSSPKNPSTFGTGQTFPPRTTSTSSSGSRSVSGTSTNFAGRSIYGFPSGGYFGRYGMNNFYLYYLLSSSNRHRSAGNCVAYASTESDRSRLQVLEANSGQSPSDNGNGEKSVAAPYTVTDTVNFAGNATFNPGTMSVIFSGSKSDFGDRLSAAERLNATALGTQLNQDSGILMRDLWSNTPKINISTLAMEQCTVDLKGLLFSFTDDLVLAGDFTATTSSFVINGFGTSLNETTIMNLQLDGVSSVSVSENGGLTLVSFGITAPSTLQITNLNVTTGTSFLSNGGTFSFSGGSVEMNECEGDSNSGVPVVLIIVVCIVLLFICIAMVLHFNNRATSSQKNNISVYTPNRTEYTTAFQPNPSYTPSTMSPYGMQNGQALTSYNYDTPPAQFNNEDLPPPPFHNVKDVGTDSLQRSNQFFEIFPVGSPIAIQAAMQTAILPPSIGQSTVKSTMMLPRQFPDFPFNGQPPFVDIGSMDSVIGTQTITIITNQDVSIQCNQPLLPRKVDQPPSFYQNQPFDECFYSVRIVNMDPNATIAIGYATCPYPPFRMPGWDPNSIGYHSDDGAVFMNDTDYGQPCGRALQVGDTLGVGFQVTPELGGFSTTFYIVLNGNRYAQQFSERCFNPSTLYPTIGADGNCELLIEFGDPNQVFFPFE